MKAAPDCSLCNDSGEYAVSASTGSYRAAGPVPDDARGVVAVDCECEAGFTSRNATARFRAALSLARAARAKL